MGLIRFLLALAVQVTHLGPLAGALWIDSENAVQVFFALSGFYMALALETKYDLGRNGKYWPYLQARIWKIFPAYILVLAFTFLGQVAFHNGAFARLIQSDLSAWTLVQIAFSNLFILGQDLLHFFSYTDLRGEALEITRFIWVPQAWSLALEFEFYLIAPFLVRWRTSQLIALGAISLLGRLYIGHFTPLAIDPWIYRFFPVQLVLFVTGILTVRFYRRYQTQFHRPALAHALLLGMAVASLTFGGITNFIPHDVASLGFLGLTLLTACYSVTSLKGVKWNEFLGSLSYPIYICHLSAGRALEVFHVSQTWIVHLVALSLAVAVTLFLDEPIAKWRARKARASSSKTSVKSENPDVRKSA